MQFGEYLNRCRRQMGLTQEQLTVRLYEHHEIFEGLDTVTMSRWERGVTRPSAQRMRAVLECFLDEGVDLIAAFPNAEKQRIRAFLSRNGTVNSAKLPRQLVVDFPDEIYDADALTLLQPDESRVLHKYLRLLFSVDSKISRNYSGLKLDHYEGWLEHAGSFFVGTQYHDQFFGALFAIRLHPDSFERVLSQAVGEAAISESMLARSDEEGCEYPVSFFAYNRQSASRLWQRYHLHLLQHHAQTRDVGRLIKNPVGRKVSGFIGLQCAPGNDTVTACRCSIREALFHPNALKIYFG